MERLRPKRKNTGRIKAFALAFALLYHIGGFALTTDCPEWEICLRTELVEIAESQLYVREATNNNDGKEVKRYLRSTGLREGYPWCAAFVTWVFEKAGVETVKSARVVDWFKSNVVYKKSWKKTHPGLQKGMVVRFTFSHIGIITKDYPAWARIDRISTIEGNTNLAGSREGHGVYRKSRDWSIVTEISDKVLVGSDFVERYDDHLQNAMK